MARYLVDTNMLDHKELAAFLAADPSNEIVISEATLIEIHKARAAQNVPRLLALACANWDRVSVTHSFYDLYSFDGTANDPAKATISMRQSEDFPAYCATVVVAPLDVVALQHFARKQADAAQESATIASKAPGLMRLYRRVISSNFSEKDRQELRKRRPLSPALQEKLLKFSFALRARLALQHGNAPEDLHPRKAIDTPLYRYALSLVIYFMHWVKDGEPDRKKIKEAVNQIVDLEIAALATFYDGFLTRETKLARHFDELQGLVEILGGKVRCG
ncbi:hypothetical protein [Brevundimonas subvibrioides]|uniref:hypothetical protein n=1 Tax=Brevundimonas subvibrioides TaxID=74313 RepID=UPI0022B2FE2B|nr:hypothetical protein [Brevundimonas subvibrioides]